MLAVFHQGSKSNVLVFSKASNFKDINQFFKIYFKELIFQLLTIYFTA